MNSVSIENNKKWFHYAKIEKTFFNKAIKIIAFVTLQALVDVMINLIDNVILGHTGEAIILGEVSAGAIIFVIFSLLLGGTAGASVYGAQFYGAKNRDKFRQVLRFRLWFAFTIVTIISIFVFIFAKELVQLTIKEGTQTGVDPNLINDATNRGIDYLKLNMLAFFPFAISLSLISSLRDSKKIMIPFYATMGIFVLKIILAPIMVYLAMPKDPIVAIGITTIIVRLFQLAIIIGIIYWTKSTYCYLGRDWWRCESQIRINTFKKTLPLLINEFFWALAISSQAFLFAKFGPDTIAAFQGAWVSNDVIFTVFTGLSAASAILIGNTLGKGNLQKAKDSAKYLLWLTFYVAIFFTILQIIFSFFLPELINQSLSREIKSNSTNIMLILSTSYVIMALNATLFFILRAGGDIMAVFAVDTGFTVFIWFSLLLVLTQFTSLDALLIYFLINVIQIVRWGLSMYFYKKNKWVVNLAK